MKITVEVRQVSFGNDMEKIKAKTKVDATIREYLEKNVFEAKDQLKQQQMQAIEEAKIRANEESKNKGQGGI